MTRRRGGGRYGNVEKPVIDGHRFDSGREAERYQQLKLLLAAGEIRDLELQPKIPIVIAGIPIMLLSSRYHKNGRHLTYVGDFRYFDVKKDQLIIEDVKMQSGHRTESYRIKRALVAAMGIDITEV